MSLGAPGKRCGPVVELGVGDGAGERGHLAVPIMRERAAEERIEHVLDRDAAGELGDAVLGPFKVADGEVMVERGLSRCAWGVPMSTLGTFRSVRMGTTVDRLGPIPE